MIKSHLGPVWIMQVSLFSSVHINRFHCTLFKTLYEYGTQCAQAQILMYLKYKYSCAWPHGC